MSEPAATARELLAGLLAPEVVDALETLAAEAVREELARSHAGVQARAWYTVAEAAERLGCSPDAIRMRVKRDRLEARRQGRRLYISAPSVEALR